MFSKPYINKMLQATNAETLPMRMNSVRYIEPYKGSLDPQDLLDLYVGDTHYRQINKALRAPDIQQARQQVWDEAGLMRTKENYPGLPEEYNTLMSSITPSYDGQDVIKQFVGDTKNDAFDVLEFTPEQKLAEVPSKQSFKYHPLSYTTGFSKLPIGKQAEQIIDYELPEKQLITPSLKDRIDAESYLNQTLASIPHIEQAFKTTQPQFKTGEQVVVDWTDPEMVMQYESAKKDNLAAQNFLSNSNTADDFYNLVKKKWEYSSFLQQNKGDKDKTLNELASYYQKSYQDDWAARNITQLDRGLHFKNVADAQAFSDMHNIGDIVEYPSFTSTTIDPDIQNGFAGKRKGEIPVLMSIRPRPGSDVITGAYDANNSAEAEYVMMPGSRVRVLERKPLPATDKNPAGLSLVVEDATGQLTPVEQRTNNILSRMKPRLANIGGEQPEPGHRMASFEQRPDGYVQSYVNQEPYKLLTEQEAQVAIDKLRPNPQWQMSWKNMAY